MGTLTMTWTGDPDDEARIAPFLRRGDGPAVPPVCWWLEPDLTGRCDLLVTRQLSKADPVRVRPGDAVVFDGREFSAVRARR